MKRLMAYLSIGIALSCLFFSIFMVNILAREPQGHGMVSYYTCIQVQPGDTLWSIAETYADGTGITVEEYVQRLKQMNHMKEDTIHEGHYLTVMYLGPSDNKK